MIIPMSLWLVSCDNQIEPLNLYEELKSSSSSIEKNYDPMWLRHHDSALKILAIGNSFTLNATTNLPELINFLNEDKICFATLTRGGASLEYHWNNHINNNSSYSLNYSDNGNWTHSAIKTIDEALRLLDWDIIVIQQVSSESGLYDTYQPYLDNLVGLFRETNPGAQLAWHYTWAYTPWYKNDNFKNYNYDSEKMYNAILEAGDKASLTFDLSIPSATLIKQMREEFPEDKNGFSDDGIHITDNFAQYSLSSLWYETLISPYFSISSLKTNLFPGYISYSWKQKVINIIKDLTEYKQNQDQTSSVGMIFVD